MNFIIASIYTWSSEQVTKEYYIMEVYIGHVMWDYSSVDINIDVGIPLSIKLKA